MLKVAITGNIASGKSQVEQYLSKIFPVYDTDKIAHKFLNELKDFYGYDVFTEGKIDRKKLGKLVFSNPELKEKLEAIIHPQVKETLNNIFEKHKNDKFIFVSVPLLFEAGFDGMFDKIILVTTDDKTRLQRLMKRDNLTEEEALIRIKSQISEKEKIKKSDFIINNNSDIHNLEIQINQFLTLSFLD